MSDPSAKMCREAEEIFGRAQELAIAEKTEEAFGPYLEAAVLGIPPAAYMVSQLYYSGIGTPEDDGKALTWAYSVADIFPAAGGWLKEAYPEGLPSDEELLRIFTQEAKAGNPAGMLMAGRFLEIGRGAEIDVDTAYSLYCSGESLGNPFCTAAKASCLTRGCGVKADAPAGAAIFKDLADRGYISGMLGYADCLEKGIGVKKDRAQALETYKTASNAGCSLAKYHIGRFYLDGIGVEEDRREALTWFELSESAGNPYGTFGIARCTLAGVVNSVGEGVGMLKDAFEKGCTEAGLMLAQMYAKGNRSVKKDPAKALEYFTKTAMRGNPTAEAVVARTYAAGEGVPKNNAMATKFYIRAGLHGNVEAMFEAGNAYLTGNGIAKDEAKGFRLLSMAADEGFMKAAYLIANCYATGKGAPKDRKKALELHNALAEKGYIRSMVFVGECLYNGDNIQRDVDKAVGWFSKGAEAGNVFCMYWMGDAYEHGNGVPKDMDKAMEWYAKAADKGHVMSRKKIQQQKDLESPFDGFMKQAEAGDAQSMYMIGMCYESGVRVEKDPVKAREWYSKAAGQGNEAAKRALELLDQKDQKATSEDGAEAGNEENPPSE